MTAKIRGENFPHGNRTVVVHPEAAHLDSGTLTNLVSPHFGLVKAEFQWFRRLRQSK